MTRPTPRAIASAIAVVVLLASCTGDRPTVTPQQGPSRAVSTDPAVNAVSELLLNPTQNFTAEYSIQPTSTGSTKADSTVWRSGERQRVQVRDVEYFVGESSDVTCFDGRANCTPGLDDGPISDLNVTHEYWAAATNRRLLSDASRKIGTASGYTKTIAGQPATCVDLPLAATSANGTVTYCATDAGIVARYIGADTEIELVSFEATVDEAELTAPTLPDN